MKASKFSSSSLRVVVGVLLLVGACVSWSYVPVSDSNLISSADSIVLGSVVDNSQDSQSGVSGAWTNYEVEIMSILKSSDSLKRRLTKKRDSNKDSIVVSVIGGYDAAANQSLYVAAAPTYEIGDKVLLFLTHDVSSENGMNQLTHFALGSFQKLEILTDLNSPPPTKETEKEYVLIRNFDLAQLENQDAHIAVRKYGDFIRHIVRTISVEPDETQNLRVAEYWTQMTSDSMAERSRARYNVFKYQQKPIRWRVFDKEGTSVTWHRDSAGQSGLDGGASVEFRKAMNVWNEQPNTPISYIDGGETSVKTAFVSADGVNTIVFQDPKNIIAGSYQCGIGGTLALGGWWTSGKVYNFRGVQFSELVEADIVVQDGIECWFQETTNPSASYANLMAHELGHTLGLDHSCGDTNQKCAAGSAAVAAVMRSYVHNNAGAFLGADDDKGIEYIYSTCYPNCAPSNVSYGHEEEELQREPSDTTFLGLNVKDSIIVGCVTLFVIALTVVIIIIVVVTKKRRRYSYETGRSRSSSLIIDPYDNIDISTYTNGPQGYISPTRLSYFDHFAAVSNLQQQQLQQQQLQQQQQSNANGVNSPYKVPRPYTNVGLHASKISLDDQN